MPAPGAIKLADANVWLALAFSDHQHHALAGAWFDAQAESACAFCRVTQLALLRHLTNSKIMGRFVQSQQDAWRNFDRLANDPRVVWLNEPAGLEAAFRTFAQSGSPAHERWTDAYLAAFSLACAGQLVTFDRGFSRFVGLDLLTLAT
jgi:toxin-antitoxin system PIN domain toxin